MQIPKILHFIWLQGLEAMPPKYRACFDSWAPQHPDWEVKLWTRQTLPLLVNGWCLTERSNLTVQADVIRVELIEQFGGVYLDCDMECKRPIDPFLAEVDDAFVSLRCPGWLENAGFGAVPHHPWLRDIIAEFMLNRAGINRVLDVDPPFARAADRYPKLVRLPFEVLNAPGGDEVAAYQDRCCAIHHRFSPWMATDDRFKDRYVEK